MVEAPEAVGYVTLDKPDGPGPGDVNVPQCGMTSPASPETVGIIRELRVVVCFQQYPDDFSD